MKEENYVTVTPEAYCSMRDELYKNILLVGTDHGFGDVTLNVNDTLATGEKFVWDIKVTFRKEAKK